MIRVLLSLSIVFCLSVAISSAQICNYSDLEIITTEETKEYRLEGRPYTGFAVYQDTAEFRGRLEYHFEDGELILQEGFYENGQIERHFPFANGKEEGIFRMFYQNGQMYIEQYFENGKLHGTLRRWNSQGVLVRHSIFENGVEVEKILDPSQW